jgi:branched-chain amino acid transport system substrate-binding protein
MIKRRDVVTGMLAGTALAALPLRARAESKGSYKIGTVLSVTGPGAFLGDNMKRGMELAIEEINGQGGIGGKKIDWVFYDAETQSTKGVNATRRLVEQDQVDIIVGGGNASGIALAMVPIVEKAGMPFISTEGSMQIVNPVAERKWTFKSTIDDDQILEVAADFWKKRGIASVAFLADSSGFGASAKEQLEKIAPKHGLKVLYETFNPGDTDLTAQLSRIKASDAKSILCWTITPTGVVFLKQARELGLGDRTLMHSYGFVDERYMKLADGAADGTFLLSVKFPVGADLPAADPQKARILDLIAKYEKKYGKTPNQFVAQTYDAINLAALALKAGGGDRAKTRAALEGIQNFAGVGGTFNFAPGRHSGLSKNDGTVIAWRDGRWRLAVA